MQLNTIADKIFSLKKENKLNDALEVYKDEIHGLYDRDAINKYPWLISNIMYCLRKTGKPQPAIDFYCKFLKNVISNETPEQIFREYGWNIYNIINSGKTCDGQCAYNFLNLVNIEKDYLLFSRLFFLLQNQAGRRENPNWNEIITHFEKYIPDQFTDESFTINKKIKENIKQIETASDRERYYMMYSKALFQQKRYNDCIDICKEAFDKIKRFHGGNNLWLSRRLSLCYTNIGKLEKAIEGFEKIANKKSDWFIQSELSNLYYSDKRNSDAMIYGCKAAINGGLSEYKVNLFVLLGNIFLAEHKLEIPCLHFSLSRSIRNEKNWKIPNELEIINCPEISLTAKELYEKLKPIWEKFANETTENEELVECKGKISLILHDGSNGDGFINDTTGRGVYFTFPVVKGDQTLLKKGLNVSFKAKQRIHKGKTVWNAVVVKIV